MQASIMQHFATNKDDCFLRLKITTTDFFFRFLFPFFKMKVWVVVYHLLKGGLLDRMVVQFLNVLELFSGYKSKLSNFRFC